MERLAKGFTWVGSLLLLIGILGGWRMFLRPEHLTSGDESVAASRFRHSLPVGGR